MIYRRPALPQRGRATAEEIGMKAGIVGTRLVAVTVLFVVSSAMLAAQAAGSYAARAAGWRKQINQTLCVPDKLPQLEAKVWSSFSPAPGVIADRVTYRTASGMLVPTIVYRPEHWVGQVKGAKLPGMVIVNGHGGDKFSWYALYSGMMFAQAGAEVVT